MSESVRIDKWLWAVRIFKTRSLASEACQKGRVFIGGMPVKPSRTISPGDIVKVKKSPVTYSFKVLALAEKRMSAKLTEGFVEDITPAGELEIIEIQKQMKGISRDRGTGRPTKKDRRKLDGIFDF